MAKRQPIVVAGETFASRAALYRHVRDKIYRPQPLKKDLSKKKFEFMCELLKRHKKYEQKAGPGIRRIWVQEVQGTPYYTKAFHLERVNGTTTDFSFKECIHPSSVKADVVKAFRNETTEVTKKFREAFFKKHEYAICPVTHRRATFQCAHVDHAPPNTFQQIVHDFMSVEGLTWDDVKLDSHGDHKIGDTLYDREFAERWLEFHNERAVLRILHPHGNLKTANDHKLK